jgi:hypothetical protein
MTKTRRTISRNFLALAMAHTAQDPAITGLCGRLAGRARGAQAHSRMRDHSATIAVTWNNGATSRLYGPASRLRKHAPWYSAGPNAAPKSPTIRRKIRLLRLDREFGADQKIRRLRDVSRLGLSHRRNDLATIAAYLPAQWRAQAFAPARFRAKTLPRERAISASRREANVTPPARGWRTSGRSNVKSPSALRARFSRADR